MAISRDEWDTRYQRLFDLFVRTRGLDIEFDSWPAEAEAEWDAEVQKFMERFPAPQPTA